MAIWMASTRVVSERTLKYQNDASKSVPYFPPVQSNVPAFFAGSTDQQFTFGSVKIADWDTWTNPVITTFDVKNSSGTTIYTASTVTKTSQGYVGWEYPAGVSDTYTVDCVVTHAGGTASESMTITQNYVLQLPRYIRLHSFIPSNANNGLKINGTNFRFFNIVQGFEAGQQAATEVPPDLTSNAGPAPLSARDAENSVNAFKYFDPSTSNWEFTWNGDYAAAFNTWVEVDRGEDNFVEVYSCMNRSGTSSIYSVNSLGVSISSNGLFSGEETFLGYICPNGSSSAIGYG